MIERTKTDTIFTKKNKLNTIEEELTISVFNNIGIMLKNIVFCPQIFVTLLNLK